MMINKEHDWELIEEHGNTFEANETYRLEVPGGWIYKIRYYSDDLYDMNCVFVPFPENYKKTKESVGE